MGIQYGAFCGKPVEIWRVDDFASHEAAIFPTQIIGNN
jgi:hypothetical protein